MAHRAPVFGGTPIDEIVALVENGFATWTDTDERDDRVIAAQTALLVRAPLETVFQTTADFENQHRFVRIAQRSRIHSKVDNTLDITLRQGFGLPFLSVGLHERFRFRVEPPERVLCEAYLGGSFSHAFYESHCFPLDSDRTLFILSFVADLASLGWLTRFFLAFQPELEFALAANVGLIPASQIADEAERRAGRKPGASRPPALPLWDAIGRGMLGPALRHGYVTHGRYDPQGEVMDVACATRLGLSRKAAWDAVIAPETLVQAVSFVEQGRTVELTDSRLRTELFYRVRLGPFSRRYEMTLDADISPIDWVKGRRAVLNGLEVKQGNFFFSAGDDTVLCHLFHTNLKQDWLMRIFFRKHEEFARVIATYGSVIVVRALRLHLGGPSDRSAGQDAAQGNASDDRGETGTGTAGSASASAQGS